MKKKVCRSQAACKNIKPQSVNKFHKCTKASDGRQSYCKLCAQHATKEAYRRNLADPEWVESTIKERRKIYRLKKKSVGFRTEKRITTSAYRKRHPQKSRAVYLANRAIQNGTLKKKTWCERCGRKGKGVRIEKHHADYSQPLQVEFLCQRCHKAEHRAIRLREAA